jgi:hypothetical protein
MKVRRSNRSINSLPLLIGPSSSTPTFTFYGEMINETTLSTLRATLVRFFTLLSAFIHLTFHLTALERVKTNKVFLIDVDFFTHPKIREYIDSGMIDTELALTTRQKTLLVFPAFEYPNKKKYKKVYLPDTRQEMYELVKSGDLEIFHQHTFVVQIHILPQPIPSYCTHLSTPLLT